MSNTESRSSSRSDMVKKHDLFSLWIILPFAADCECYLPVGVLTNKKRCLDATGKKECNNILKEHWKVFVYLMYAAITLFLTLLYMIFKQALDLILRFHQFQRRYILGENVNDDNATRIEHGKEKFKFKSYQYIELPTRTRTKAKAKKRIARRKSDTFIARTTATRRSSFMNGAVLSSICEGYEYNG